MKQSKVIRNVTNPVYQYTSVCCQADGTKPPCVKPRDKKDSLVNSLGHWRCTACRKPCSVTRHKIAVDKETEA